MPVILLLHYLDQFTLLYACDVPIANSVELPLKPDCETNWKNLIYDVKYAPFFPSESDAAESGTRL